MIPFVMSFLEYFDLVMVAIVLVMVLPILMSVRQKQKRPATYSGPGELRSIRRVS